MVHFSSKEILSGTSAGVVGTLFGHPLDTIKVRLQTQTQYKGALDCLIKVAKNEGLRGFYKGVTSPLVSLTFLNSFAFGIYGELKREINHNFNADKKDLNNLPPYQYFLAGAFSGWLTGIFSTPFEMVKLQMQLDNVTMNRYKGSLHCANLLYKEKGFRAFYTGYTVNTVREIAFCGVYFGIYENTKNFIGENVIGSGNHYSSIAIPLAGGMSGVSAWFLSFPLDCIKANIQGKPLTQKYKFGQVVQNIWKQRGISGFYSGLRPSLLRAFIVSSSRFTAYEVTFNLLTEKI